VTARTLTLGGRAYPVILPNIRDPRLHVAAVIITVHVLGQVGLHFRVSIPQILAAILTCAILEIALTFRQSRAFVWPASAMLTGSGVALILRVVGTPPDEPWTIDGWQTFAVVAGLSLLTKYVIKYRGTHVFNPSNIGLVVAFVVLGSSRVEPLDFWWAPLNVWMLTAYAVIIVVGVLITRRLRLLTLAAAFWITLAAATGLLAASGHCMTANWAFAPVCGVDFWRVIVTSPEVLIFLFFMITDPKTVPPGAVGRTVFGCLVGVASALLIGPQTDEYGTKVGLLAGLVVICAARPIVDRLVPAAGSEDDDLRRFASGAGVPSRSAPTLARRSARAGVAALLALAAGLGVIAAGSPSRGPVASVVDPAVAPPAVVDPATLPDITVSDEVADYDPDLADGGIQDVLLTLAQNLELAKQALLNGDADLLVRVDHGDRLAEMQARLADAERSGITAVTHFAFDTVDVSLLVPFGRQDGLSLGLMGRGTATEERYDASGALLEREASPFALTFAMRQATGARWLNVAVLPEGGE